MNNNLTRLDALAAQRSHTDTEIDEFLDLYSRLVQTMILDPARVIERQIDEHFEEFLATLAKKHTKLEEK